MSYPQLYPNGAILIIEDDEDDQFIFNKIFEELHIADKVVYFSNTLNAIQYLRAETTRPFLIISDINLPMQNGLDFKQQINSDPALRDKCIPFIFLSTSIKRTSVDKAFKELSVQGFFQKNDDYKQLKQRLYLILEYWQYCQHPNSF